jgi:TrmH family RNA methyltransferase
VITSRDNEKLKLVRKLHERRWRDKLGLFVVEGEDLVDSARAAGLEPVELLVAGANVEPAVLAEVSALAHPPRVAAIFRKPEPVRSPDMAPPDMDEGLTLGHAGSGRVRPPDGAPTLLLWRVADPGNVGTLLRSADAFGARVALSSGSADPYGPKALRAAMGSTFRVPLVEFAVSPGSVALVPRGAPPLHDLELPPTTTFVLGAEREGLPKNVLAQCERRAAIVQHGGVDSLNVAMAGTIALYELARRGHAS